MTCYIHWQDFRQAEGLRAEPVAEVAVQAVASQASLQLFDADVTRL